MMETGYCLPKLDLSIPGSLINWYCQADLKDSYRNPSKGLPDNICAIPEQPLVFLCTPIRA